MGLSRYVDLKMPISLFVELIYLLCMVIVLSSKKSEGSTKYVTGTMLVLYAPWLFYSIIEIGNMSSEIDYMTILTRWFAEVRTMGFQVIYGMIICAVIFAKKEQIKTMFKIWGLCILICTAKTLMQQFIGFDNAENEFLAYASRTHFVNGIIRYFSLFSDASNYGCHMAAATGVFGAVTLSVTKKKEKIYFAIVTVCALYGMLASGTRTGVFVLAAAGLLYAVLSKRISALITTLVFGGTFFAILMFTNIGQGNSMVRRMRSAFNKEDASTSVREMNQLAMKRYIDELPLGLGAGIRGDDVPPSNKNHFLSVVAPDSTWVYVNIHYGHLGKYIFLFSFISMCFYAGYIVFFRIRDPELRGLLSAMVCGSSAMVLAGYANQIMLQYPNCYVYFGQLMIVYLGPEIEKRALEAQKKKEMKKLEESAIGYDEAV